MLRPSCRERKKAGVGSKARRPVGRDLPKLLDPASGAPATSTAARDSIWLRYFGDQEAGSVLPTTEFLEEAAVSIDHVRDDWSWDLLPSRTEIEAVLRSTAKNKCAGLDGVPSDALRVSPSHFCGTSAALVRQGTGDEPPTDTVARRSPLRGLQGAGRPERRGQLPKLIHLQLCGQGHAPSHALKDTTAAGGLPAPPTLWESAGHAGAFPVPLCH